MHSASVFSHTAMELGFLLRFCASTHALAVVIFYSGYFTIRPSEEFPAPIHFSDSPAYQFNQMRAIC